MIGGFVRRAAAWFGGRRSSPARPPELGQRARIAWGGLAVPYGLRPHLPWLGAYTPWDVPDYVRKIMRRMPQIRLGLTAIKAPFYGITYRAVGGEPRARALVQATLLESPLFDRLLGVVLNAPDFGFQAAEIIWGLEDVALDLDGPGGEPPAALPRAYVVRDLVDLDPERVVLFVDDWGNPDGLEHDGTFIPQEKLVLASFQPEWRNWYGNAVLDPAYPPFYESQNTTEFHRAWNETKSNPPYIGYAPDDDDALVQSPDRALDGAGANPVRVLTRALMALRGGGACTLPAAFDERGNRLWEVRELETTNRTNDYLAHRRYLDDMMLRGVLVPERTVSQEGVGSYAMADAHVGVFLGLMEIIRRRLVLETLNAVAAQLVRVNFGRAAKAPRVESSELNRQSKQLLADLVAKTLETPRRTATGATYTTAEILDDVEALEALNIPHHKPRAVATGEVAPAPAAAPPPLGRTPSPAELTAHPMSPAQVAEALGVSAATVRAYANRRDAPCLRLPGGRLRFNAERFGAWLEAAQEMEKAARRPPEDERELRERAA